MEAVRGGEAYKQAARRALGMHADGMCKVLGVWPGMAAGPDPWREAVGDLRERGVHRIHFVGGDESIDVSVAFPSAAVLPLIGQSARRDLATLGPRSRMLAVDELGRLLGAGTLGADRTQLASLAVVTTGSTPN